jgi:hypothetical protein
MAGLLSRLFRSFINQVVAPTAKDMSRHAKDMSRRPQDDDHYGESPAEYRERKQYEAWIETTNASILRNERER